MNSYKTGWEKTLEEEAIRPSAGDPSQPAAIPRPDPPLRISPIRREPRSIPTRVQRCPDKGSYTVTKESVTQTDLF